MKILFLTFYFEPDLCAGSFRNTALVNELSNKLTSNDDIHVITTLPNRYSSFSIDASETEYRGNVRINRIVIPKHKSGLLDQSRSFITYYQSVFRLIKGENYDMVYASSSRLFTAFLGAKISKNNGIPLYLDIRDLFKENMKDILDNSLVNIILIPFLSIIEKYTFKTAKHINLVSEGFKSDFSSFQVPTFTFFTNGIDDHFEEWPLSRKRNEEVFTITYAGNIGEGQGLEKVIPQAAEMLGEKYFFQVVGDGGTKRSLEQAILKRNLKNVELMTPVNRVELKEIYTKADFLFMHLNNYHAFLKCLPSKVFEYGATDKPIIAGVSGYASEFVRKNLDNYILFESGDYKTLVEKVKIYQYKTQERAGFRRKFLRKKIMGNMADSIIKLLK